MAETEGQDTRTCPYCKEEIKRDAIKCKHCRSRLAPERPEHGGVCPYCKEDIKPEAIKCKHCGSRLDMPSGHGDCGSGGRMDTFSGGEPAEHGSGVAMLQTGAGRGGGSIDWPGGLIRCWLERRCIRWDTCIVWAGTDGGRPIFKSVRCCAEWEEYVRCSFGFGGATLPA